MDNQKIKVAVTGAGGGVGQSIIKALQGTQYDVVALDGEVLAAGLYAVNSAYVVPYASDPTYIDRLIEICKKENYQFLFPGLDAELMILSNNRDRFLKAGIQVIVSTPDVIEMSDDKMLTYTKLTECGITVPATVDGSKITEGNSLPKYPFILKRRVGGARSKDVFLINNQVALDRLTDGGLDLQEYIAQEYIEGDEYTCGTINNGKDCMGVIVMRRILRDGDTYKCFAVKDAVIEDQVKKLVTAIKPLGACNVQLRVKDGKPYVFEINARCSGTTAARALCGFNEPKMILDYLTLGTVPTFTITEQTVLRYWQELVVPNNIIEQVKNVGFINRNEHAGL